MNSESPLFVEGQTYELEMIEPTGDRSFVRGVLLSRDGTLLEIATDDEIRAFNTAAHTFVAVKRVKERTPSIYQPMEPPHAADVNGA